jgi:hypothetical protein
MFGRVLFIQTCTFKTTFLNLATPYILYHELLSKARSKQTFTLGFFFRLQAPKKFPYYKRYKNSRNFLDEKAKYQPWIIKIWMKKPKLDENRIKIGENLFYIHNVDECRYILLHCSILYSQLSFTANMKKKPYFAQGLIIEERNSLT